MKDLHLHLSGATDPVLLFEIINETGLKLKNKNFIDFRNSLSMKKEKVSNLQEYLSVIHQIDEAQSSPKAIERSFYKSFVDAYCCGCEYLELRWNPYKRSQNFKIDFDKLIISARSGYERAKTTFGIKGGQIFCLGRDVDEGANDAIFKKAIQYFGKSVIGIDAAGPEEKTHLKPEFENYYKTANALGMMTTIHAGERYYDGVDETFSTIIENYKVKRIGHGVQIYKYPSLMKLAEKAGILFEICISSNLTTQAVKDEKEFVEIFKTFEEYGIKYQICTDAVYPLETNIHLENQRYEKIKKMANK